MSFNLNNIKVTEGVEKWLLTLLMIYFNGKPLKLPTKIINEYFYECPECGSIWADEYSKPNFCPKCGEIPMLRSKKIKVLDLPNLGVCINNDDKIDNR